MLARVRHMLPTVEEHAPMVCNLFADLLINDRLQRARGLNMAGVFEKIGGGDDPLWTFYLRTYEILWSLTTGQLTGCKVDERSEMDARLAARVVRLFGDRWLSGSKRYAALCLPYLLDQSEQRSKRTPWLDAIRAGAGGLPEGLSGLDDDEREETLHPAFDPEIFGAKARKREAQATAELPVEVARTSNSGGQYREPFEFGELLRATGLDLTDHEVAIRYYQERASHHLIPFPTSIAPVRSDPQPEGVESWDIGLPIADIDWFESITRSPVVVPGFTTVQRTFGETEGDRPKRVPLDLDLYVDSSGSMPDPQRTVSFLALAGAIVALSALRAGARVQVTLWSGPDEFMTTRGFVTDQRQVLGVLVGFFGGSTAFPIHVLRDTYIDRKSTARPAHILVISDDGVDTMYADDEHGVSGRGIASAAMAKAGGGGTLALNVSFVNETLAQFEQDGWSVHGVQTWDDLVEFGRSFSKRHYGSDGARRGETNEQSN